MMKQASSMMRDNPDLIKQAQANMAAGNAAGFGGAPGMAAAPQMQA